MWLLDKYLTESESEIQFAFFIISDCRKIIRRGGGVRKEERVICFLD